MMSNLWINAYDCGKTVSYVESEFSGKKREHYPHLNIELEHEEAKDGIAQLRGYAIKLLNNKSLHAEEYEVEVEPPNFIKLSPFVKEWQTIKEKRITTTKGNMTTRDYIRSESGFADPSKREPGGFNVTVSFEAEPKQFPSYQEMWKDLREFNKDVQDYTSLWPMQLEMEEQQ